MPQSLRDRDASPVRKKTQQVVPKKTKTTAAKTASSKTLGSDEWEFCGDFEYYFEEFEDFAPSFCVEKLMKACADYDDDQRAPNAKDVQESGGWFMFERLVLQVAQTAAGAATIIVQADGTWTYDDDRTVANRVKEHAYEDSKTTRLSGEQLLGLLDKLKDLPNLIVVRIGNEPVDWTNEAEQLKFNQILLQEIADLVPNELLTCC